jgi:hypothetical protein
MALRYGLFVLLAYMQSNSVVIASKMQGDQTLWTQKYGYRSDMPFSGITTFAHLPTFPCLDIKDPFDIAIVGYPFDTAVSYRPGARFGPHGIRDGSRRLRRVNGWSLHWEMNPYDGSVSVVDCGDVSLRSTERFRLMFISYLLLLMTTALR